MNKPTGRIRVLTPNDPRPGPRTGFGTLVLMPDGSDVPGVVSVEIPDIKSGSMLYAKLTIELSQIDIDAHPLLSETTVLEAAAHYGWKVVQDDETETEF